METFEYALEWETDRWWAATPISGTLAVGSGASPWEAVSACYADLPRAQEFVRQTDEMLFQAREGKFSCPGCGSPRPKLGETPWYPYCSDCRGDDDEPA